MPTVAPPLPPLTRTPPAAREHAGALVLGGVLGFLSLALAVTGAAFVLAYAFGRDSEGYFTSSTERLATTTPALTAERIQIGDMRNGAGDWLASATAADARIRVRAAGGGPIFVGVASQANVDRFLSGVAHDRVVDLHNHAATYQRTRGAMRPSPPPGGPFWLTSASGPGEQTVTFEVHEGRWAAVVMRPDGRAGVSAYLNVGARSDAVVWIGLALLALGAAGLVGTAAIVRRATRKE